MIAPPPNYYMPAEWHEHEATWLSWPKDPTTFPKGLLENVETIYCQMIENLVTGEKVKILINDAKWQEKVTKKLEDYGISLKNIIFYQIPSVDVWIRDYAPLFIVNKKERKRALTKWIYNAYGNKYEDLLKDNVTGMQIAKATKLPIYEPKIVLEGGSIDVNDEGMLLTTEQCLLNKNRNPLLTKEWIETYLRDFLGVNEIIWLTEGVEGDDTDGHVDDITRFVDNNTILTVLENNKNDANYAPLKKNYELLKKTKFEIKTLPMPKKQEIKEEERRLPLSYANFYIGNSAILLPVFNDKNDEKAIEILEECFPKRKIVPIYARDLVYGYGGIHCATMQESKV